MKKRMFTLLLAAVMLLTLAACGNAAEDIPAPSESEEAATQAPTLPPLTQEELDAMLPAEFIGRTVGDLFSKYGTEYFRNEYNNSTYLEFEGTPAFLLGFYPSFVTEDMIVRQVIAGGRKDLLDDIKSDAIYPEIQQMVGDEVVLGEPVYHNDELNMTESYTLVFEYKGYRFEYIWYSDPLYTESNQTIITKLDVPVTPEGY